jgi:cytochrome c5
VAEDRKQETRKKRKGIRTDMYIKRIVGGSIVVLVVATALLAACGGVASTETMEPTQEEQPTTEPTEAPEEEEPPAEPAAGDGAALLEERCTVCHGLERTTQAQKTAEEWEQTVMRMVGKGAQLAEDEQATLIEYLTATYGP